jgi:pimeloyl-ACP methyl ester carboxylesterase
MSASGKLGVLALACIALSLGPPATANAQPAPLAFTACRPTQVFLSDVVLQCGVLDVPFDRADPSVGDIALAVQRVPASAPRVGVIVLLAGGPGQPALPAFEGFLAPLARDPALRGYELVAFDQRGTGQSGGLLCPGGEEAPKGLTPYFGACGAALGATRGLYTSQESVEDLNALREALGGTPLSLFAVSYGTRVAGIYTREHPQGVARMVLDSTVPTTGPDPLGLERLHALRRVLDEGICGAGACRSFSSNVYADLTHLVNLLHRHPLRTHIYNERGRLRPASVTELGVLRLLSGTDLSLGMRELAPAAIAAAAHGDAAPLAQLTHPLQTNGPSTSSSAQRGAETASGDGSLGDGAFAAKAPPSASYNSDVLFTATACVEDQLPWSPESAPAGRASTLRDWLASLPPNATAPFAPATALADSDLPLCLDWPATPAAPLSPTGVSETPTLILSGDQDLRTPYEQALTIATTYSDATLLRIPDVGHSTVTDDQTGCARRAMIAFLTSGHAPASCPASKEPQAIPLPPPSLDKVQPLPSRSRLVGQVAAAAAITIENLWGQIELSSGGGGIQGGYWRLSRTKLTAHHLVDVRGVAISGSASLRSGVAHFTVHGQLNGTLTQRGVTVTGRLGGMSVHMHLVET